MRIIGYIRVSTGEQADSGNSLETQRHKLTQYADLYGHDLVDVLVDAGVSAKTLDRPGLQRVLAALTAREVDGLLVYKLDRLTRSVRDLGALIEDYFDEGSAVGASLLSVRDSIDTSTATGRLMLNLLASVSQWEREVIAERTREVLGHMRSEGKRVGSVPYGYRVADDGTHLVIDERERAAVLLAMQMRGSGCTLRAIAERLHDEGHRNRAGRRIHPETVRGMLGERAQRRRRLAATH